MMSVRVVTTLLVILQSSVFLNAQSSDTRECLSNRDCASDKLCAEFKCINPCLLNVCDDPKSCRVNNHIPVCACNCGFSGTLSNLDGQRPSPSKEKKFQLNTIVKMNWFQALAHCTANNMRLASIDNKQEHEKLIAQIRQASLGAVDFWTSGTDQGDYGNYLWISSGRPITYFDWFNGEPNHWNHNGTVEKCVQLPHRHNYQMNDAVCDERHLHVCEYYV